MYPTESHLEVRMRILASFTAAMLFLLLLASGPCFAQDEKPDHPQGQQQKEKDTKSKPDAKQDEKARQDETKRDESRPAGKQDNARPENRRPEEARPQEQTRSQEQARPDQGGNARPVQAQRGQRIPDDKFRARFGREHHFHVKRAESVNQAQPQFVYAGYSFQLGQAWPADWSYDDDCYIEYVGDNYYLYDLNHPGIQILVFVIG
jgi:hypothetical protein